MTDRPILFSAPMVRALIEGRKTQTRRVLKPQPVSISDKVDAVFRYAPGDRLWVREAWAAGACADGLSPAMLAPGFWRNDNGGLWYAADGAAPQHPVTPKGRNRASLHMPRWASRLTLMVTGVKVERLQDCSEADAIAEGCDPTMTRDGISPSGMPFSDWSFRLGYSKLWDQINGPGAWDANPWVCAVSFTVHHANIDQMGEAA